jgi:DNA polymerase-3 subunit gamma/tau
VALALYRTYRPGSLAEVIGQEHVTEPLARALDAGRTHHAYLFSGPRGCGKTSTARILARSLNCEQGPTAHPCGQCRSCVELAPNGPGSIDVVELDAATHRGIDDARELREKAIYAPAASRFKIYIIDEAHQLTNEAANALLKLVEEPPPHLRFIFATTEPDKIIPTIRSRTFHYGFRLVPARLLAEHLGSVCRAEGTPAEGSALAVVARAGAGSVRDSLSVLGQLLAGAGPDGLTYADAVSSLGLTDDSLIDAFVAALSAGSAGDMFAVVDRVISAGHDPRRFVSDVLDRLRDLLILRADPGALSSGLVDVPDDAGERMLAQAQCLGLSELSRAADLVSAGLGEMKGATAPRLQLELLCARLALPTVADDLSAVLARLERLERVAGSGGPTTGGSPGRAAAPPSVPPVHVAATGPGTSTGSGVAAPAPLPEPVAEVSRPSASEGSAGASAEAGVRPAPAAARAATPAGRPAPPRRPELRTAARPGPGGNESSAAGGGAPRQPAETGPDDALARPEQAGDGPSRPEVASKDTSGSGEGPGALVAAPSGQPKPTATTAQSPGVVDATPITAVQSAWPAVLDRLAGKSRVAWFAFQSAAPVSLSQGVLAVAVSELGNVRAIGQKGHDEWLRQALIDVLGLDVRIDMLHDPDAARGASGPGSPAPARPGGGPGEQGAGAPGSGGSAAHSGEAGRASTAEPVEVRNQARRGVEMVRAAAATGGPEDHPDEPSEDDPDLSGADGLALITRELGARPIGEIDHS